MVLVTVAWIGGGVGPGAVVRFRSEQMTDHQGNYAFPHAGANERRRLELFAERLDPLTVRRIKALGLAPGARCLEVGGGRGSIARWLCEYAGPAGRVTATDLDTGFLSELSLPNLDVLRHDVTSDEFPQGSFDLVHVRAVLMHIPDRMAVLRRMVSWLAPGGWLMAEDCDFGMWLAGPLISSGVMTAAEEARLEARLGEPDFLGCGFAFVGAWGRRPVRSPG